MLDCANGRLQLFRRDGDFLAFYDVLLEAQQRHSIRLLGWCLMSNHWHFVVWPPKPGALPWADECRPVGSEKSPLEVSRAR